MSVGWKNIIDLCRSLLDEDPGVREQAADSVTDWTSSYTPLEAGALARVLLMLAVCERQPSCRESQLHATAELAEAGLLSSADAAILDDLKDFDSSSSEAEYVEYLRSIKNYGE